MPGLNFETIQTCRACGYEGIVDILDLGNHPLANSFVRSREQEIHRFPLSTAFCQKCFLFQLKETIIKEILFDHYFWVTGTAKGTHDYATVFAKRVCDWVGLRHQDFVIEIASNDGTVLKQFLALGMRVMGIEPAKNIVDIALQKGVPTDCAYWDLACAKRIVSQYGRPKVVIARNVIAHVSDLHGAIKGIAEALSEDGVGVIEFHSGKVIAEELQYDSIYHEHLCYFTLHSFKNLLNKHGLFPFAIDKSPISGGAIVVYFSKIERPLEAGYQEYLKEEDEGNINRQSTWERFAQRAKEHREKTIALLGNLNGQKIIGFGSSARGSTILNFCQIGKKNLQAIIDNNPLKQGWMVPAGDVPIVSLDQGLALQPDFILLLAWNFSQEIINECDRRGYSGKYIMLFPKDPQIFSKR